MIVCISRSAGDCLLMPDARSFDLGDTVGQVWSKASQSAELDSCTVNGRRAGVWMSRVYAWIRRVAAPDVGLATLPSVLADLSESFVRRPGFVCRKDDVMKKNLGSMDRVARGLGALGLVVGAFVAPVEALLRVGLGATGAYVMFTALAGRCLGYRLMGLSTCPAEPR